MDKRGFIKCVEFLGQLRKYYLQEKDFSLNSELLNP
jgi:hypothetical protein